MIIHEHGKIKRAFIHTDAGNDEGLEKPALMIYRPAVLGRSAIIPLSCAYKWDEPDCAEEMEALTDNARNVAIALDYPVNGRSLARIICAIQDGLDELVKMPSKRVREKHNIGEASVCIDGKQTISTPVIV